MLWQNVSPLFIPMSVEELLVASGIKRDRIDLASSIDFLQIFSADGYPSASSGSRSAEELESARAQAKVLYHIIELRRAKGICGIRGRDVGRRVPDDHVGVCR